MYDKQFPCVIVGVQVAWNIFVVKDEMRCNKGLDVLHRNEDKDRVLKAPGIVAAVDRDHWNTILISENTRVIPIIRRTEWYQFQPLTTMLTDAADMFPMEQWYWPESTKEALTIHSCLPQSINDSF